MALLERDLIDAAPGSKSLEDAAAQVWIQIAMYSEQRPLWEDAACQAKITLIVAWFLGVWYWVLGVVSCGRWVLGASSCYALIAEIRYLYKDLQLRFGTRFERGNTILHHYGRDCRLRGGLCAPPRNLLGKDLESLMDYGPRLRHSAARFLCCQWQIACFLPHDEI